jgi:hypothetical protein
MAEVSVDPARKLTVGDQRLVAGAKSGVFVDLSDLSDDDRVVSASCLRGLCIGAEPIEVDPRGIQVKAARVSGLLDLRFCNVAYPLWLQDATFGEVPTLSHSRLAALVFLRCRLPGLSAYGIRVDHFVSLNSSEITGEAELSGAKIEGTLDCSATTLTNEGGLALNLDGCEVGSSVFLPGMNATGEVNLAGARIGGQLNCAGATLRNEGGRALSASAVKIETSGSLADVNTVGAVDFAGARLGGQLDCAGATLQNEGGRALNLSGADVEAGVFLRGRFSATGEVDLSFARLGGQLDCAGATLVNEGGLALTLESAEVDKSVLLRGFSAAGQLRLFGAKIRGNLDCGGATLAREGGYALDARSADVGGTVWLREGFSATGEVSFFEAKVGGALGCSRAMFANEGGSALVLDRAEIGGSVIIDDSNVIGWARLTGAKVEGTLTSDGTTLVNRGGYALSVDGAEIAHVALSELDATGAVSLVRARIEHGLRCARTKLANEGGVALDCDDVEVGDYVVLTDSTMTGRVGFVTARMGGLMCLGTTLANASGDALDAVGAAVSGLVGLGNSRIIGGVNLYRATAAALEDDVGMGDDGLGSWSGVDPLVLEGFSYARFGDRAAWGSKVRLRWVRQTRGFEAGAWQQLMSVYRAQGRDDEATTTAIAMHNDRLARAGLPTHRRAGRWILRLTVGHGYRPWLAGVWALAIISTFALLVSVRSDSFIAENENATGSPQPFVYAADTFLPIVDFGEADRWTPVDWTRWLEWGAILLGWALSTVFVAGFTRIVRS